MSRENVVPFTTGCPTGKRSYTSRKGARTVLRGMKHAKSTVDRGALSVYRCTSCSGWHVGHIPHAVKRGIADRRTLRHGEGRI